MCSKEVLTASTLISWMRLSNITVTHEHGQFVSIFKRCWDFDGATEIEISVAKLVGQCHHILRVLLDRVIDHRVVSRRRDAYSRKLADQEEVVAVLLGQSVVNHCARCWILDALVVVPHKLRLDSFIDHHEANPDRPPIRPSFAFNCRLDLLDLVRHDRLLLLLTDSIAIENNLGWIDTI